MGTVTHRDIDDFVAQKALAIVGVSRTCKGFGYEAQKELAKRGYTVFLVHPEVASIDGKPCAKSLRDVADRIGGAVLVTPPKSTEALVREAAEGGVRRVWMQQGAESPEAIRLADELGIAAVHGNCILMFAEPVRSAHKVHRWLRGLFGRNPR
jgi:hypothetical protein